MSALRAEFDLAKNIATLDGFRTRRIRVEAAVLRAAQRLEDECQSVFRWYRGDAITELGGFTAKELVDQGKGHRVLELLRAIRMGERDESR